MQSAGVSSARAGTTEWFNGQQHGGGEGDDDKTETSEHGTNIGANGSSAVDTPLQWAVGTQWADTRAESPRAVVTQIDGAEAKQSLNGLSYSHGGWPQSRGVADTASTVVGSKGGTGMDGSPTIGSVEFAKLCVSDQVAVNLDHTRRDSVSITRPAVEITSYPSRKVRTFSQK